MAGSVTINADVAALRALSSFLAVAQPAVLADFRKTINDKGGYLVGSRAQELSQWSKQIPRTIRWYSRGSLAKVTLVVSAGYKDVRIARWYELGHTNRSLSWWHPVWPGRRVSPLQDKIRRKKWHWVPQAKGASHRPYLYPALQERKGQVVQVTLNALIDATIAAVPYMHREAD